MRPHQVSSSMLICLAALAITLPAYAQVQQLQVGQSLDANYQVGSGGYNTVTGGVGGVNSQLYVNGQVTGLGSFHGRRNAVADQLQTNVPTNGLSTFQQQSVGMNDAINRSTYQAAPYYSPSASVSNVRSSVASGAGGLPGGGFAPSRYIESSVGRQLFIDATADYRPLMSPSGSGATASPMVSSSDNVYLPAVPTSPQRIENLRPGASALFNSPVAASRDDLARELREIDSRIDNRLDGLVSAKVEQDADPNKLTGRNDLITSGTFEKEAKPKDMQLTRTPPAPIQPDKPDVPPKKEVPVITANQDIFVDMLVALRQAKTGPGSAAPTAASPLESPAADLRLAGTASSLKRPGAWKAQEQPALPRPELFTYGPAQGKARVEYVQGKGIVIHGLAGESSDLFNGQMAKAEENLKKGEFYDAASQFHTAAVLSPGNPLAWVGQGLALFMAHEPSSAALSFQHAMQAFPPLMETRLDVASIIDIDKFKTQLSMLDQRLDREAWENDAPMAYLAAYLHYCVGEDDVAKNYARLLKVKGIKAPVMESFVEFMLSGNKPASQSAKQ